MTEAVVQEQPNSRALALAEEWTPEALRERIEREKALRQIAIDYYRSQMQDGVHFYRLEGQRKPALAKEGALNLCSLFKVVPDYDPPHETHEGGHYAVRYRCRLLTIRGDKVAAVGEGLCSTREDKYAFRWVWPGELPKGVDHGALVSRRVRKRDGSWGTKVRTENPNLADSFNTVLKMAKKRALVDAVLQLPLVSELFTQDLEEQAAAEKGAHPPEGDAPTLEPTAVAQPSDPRAELNANLLALGFGSADRSALQELSEKVTGKRRREAYSDVDYRRMIRVTALLLKGMGVEEAIKTDAHNDRAQPENEEARQ